MNAAQFSRGLGWFSIGLGAAEIFAPRGVARTIGVSEDHDRLIRVLGFRELTSGVGLLMRPKPTGFAWSRVAGDIMDLSLLGAAYTRVQSQPLSVSRSNQDDRRRLTIAFASVVGVTLLDVLTSVRLTQKPKIDSAWHYTPPGGRGGLRRPIEPDRPQYLPNDQQPRSGERSRSEGSELSPGRSDPLSNDENGSRQQTEAAPQGA
ncbi:MAG: hypothetical protein ABIZ04_20315 [Opitutus sp.]